MSHGHAILGTYFGLIVGLVACGGGETGTSFSAVTDPAITTVPAGSGSTGSPIEGSSSTSAAEGPSAGSTATSSGEGGTPVLDMGVPDFGSQTPVGCQGKIDFLFVIGAGGTMQNDQQRLISSFPGFMAAIEAQLPDFDVHIMSAGFSTWPLEDCKYCNGVDCDPQGAPPACGAELDACDKHVPGAGITFPAGEGASNRRCALDGGNRYITDGEPDRTEAFTCIAQVGLGGDARVAEAMVGALSPEINAPLGCNKGFLRDDALLVVTLIQDTYDSESTGQVEDWIEALRAAKKGVDDAYTVLVLTTDIDKGQWELCAPGTFDGEKNKLRLLVEGVKHGFISSICAEAYDPFFAEAVDAVVELCDGFVPPDNVLVTGYRRGGRRTASENHRSRRTPRLDHMPESGRHRRPRHRFRK